MDRKNNIYLPFFAIIALLILMTGCSTVEKQKQSPEELYEDALARIEGSKSFFGATDYEGAKIKLEEIKRKFSFTKYAPLAELRFADIYFYREQYAEAVILYEDFIGLHPNHPDVPYAFYQTGLAYFNQVDGVDRDIIAPDKALSSFNILLSRYPDSKYAVDAQEKADVCKDTLAGNEFYVGKFYYKKSKFKAAAKRFRAALEKFPGYGPKEDSLLFLGKSLLADNEIDKGKNVLKNLIKALPDSGQAEEARKLLDNE